MLFPLEEVVGCDYFIICRKVGRVRRVTTESSAVKQNEVFLFCCHGVIAAKDLKHN